MSQEYYFKREARNEVAVVIGDFQIPVASDINWHLGPGVISSSVLALSGPAFDLFRTVLAKHEQMIDGFVKICHGYNNCPQRFPCERISYEEFHLLNGFGLLYEDEVADYLRYIERQGKAPERESSEYEGRTRIYLIRDNATGLVKIGQSQDPERRLKALIDQDTLMPTPNDFTLIHHWPAAGLVERQLHCKFASERVRGEWFRLTQEDINELINLTAHE